MKELNLYFKNLNIVILILFSLNSISQNTNIKFQTGDLSLEKQKEQIVLRKSFYIDIFNSLTPEIQIEKGTYKLNYKIDESGKITFIKGHIGFLKIEIPYEFI